MISYPAHMTLDPKEQRLKALNRRFRSVGARQDFIAAIRRHARDPRVWVLGILALAALTAIGMAF
jgi:hypothetical protein